MSEISRYTLIKPIPPLSRKVAEGIGCLLMAVAVFEDDTDDDAAVVVVVVVVVASLQLVEVVVVAAAVVSAVQFAVVEAGN